MPKLDQLKTIARYTKAAIIGIIESQIDNLDPLVRLKFHITAFLMTQEQKQGGVACYVRQDLFFHLRSTIMGDIEGMFLDILLPKPKPIEKPQQE